MSILVLAEHNNIDIKASTLNTISAASQIKQEIDDGIISSPFAQTDEDPMGE